MFKEVETWNLQDKIEKSLLKAAVITKRRIKQTFLEDLNRILDVKMTFKDLKLDFFHVEIETKAQKLKYWARGCSDIWDTLCDGKGWVQRASTVVTDLEIRNKLFRIWNKRMKHDTQLPKTEKIIKTVRKEMFGTSKEILTRRDQNKIVWKMGKFVFGTRNKGLN